MKNPLFTSTIFKAKLLKYVKEKSGKLKMWFDVEYWGELVLEDDYKNFDTRVLVSLLCNDDGIAKITPDILEKMLKNKKGKISSVINNKTEV